MERSGRASRTADVVGAQPGIAPCVPGLIRADVECGLAPVATGECSKVPGLRVGTLPD